MMIFYVSDPAAAECDPPLTEPGWYYTVDGIFAIFGPFSTQQEAETNARCTWEEK